MPAQRPDDVEPDTIMRLRQREIGALAVVFERFGTQVLGLSQRILGNAADAEDVTQEIFVRVYEQASRFDGKSAFSTWLYRVAVHHCLNRLKVYNRRRRLEQHLSKDALDAIPRSDPSPLERVADHEERRIVDGLLSSLPVEYRSCLLLREVSGLSYAEIAQILAVPIGTVMSRLSRARAQLRTQLKKVRGEPAQPGNNLPGPAVKRMEERSDDLL